MIHIGKMINQTSTVRYLASTKDLPTYGFNVEFHSSLGSLMAVGSKMSHVFNIYKSTAYSNDDTAAVCLEPRITNAMAVARCREKRLNQASQHMYAVMNSTAFPRQSKISSSLAEDKPKTNAEAAEALYTLLDGAEQVTINNTKFSVGSTTSTYKRYNEQPISNDCKIDIGAIVNRKEKKALVVPSYDGKPNGRILVGLHFDSAHGYGTYWGTVYIIEQKVYKRVQLVSILDKFNYMNSMPFELDGILKVRLNLLFICFVTLLTLLLYSLLLYTFVGVS